MHAWESIQLVLDHIEDNLSSEINIDKLADIAALSPFYFQRLFARLVKRPVREYIKLRRLAYALAVLKDKHLPTLDVALLCGFNNRETFSKAFKEVYGITPSQYRTSLVPIDVFDRPNLLLNYTMVKVGVPLVSEGIVLEYHYQTLSKPIYFLGVKGYWQFNAGKMLGERPGISKPALIWDAFNQIAQNIPSIANGLKVGVSYQGDAPVGHSTYFVGTEVNKDAIIPDNLNLVSWQLPVRDYVVCQYEAPDYEQLMASMGKMMKFTRIWLKNHDLTADGFFPEIYYNDLKNLDYAYMEMWIPFKKREAK